MPELGSYADTEGSGWERELSSEEKINLSQNQIIMIEDGQPKTVPAQSSVGGKYTGKFLCKKNNVMTAGICVESNRELEYGESDIVSVSYIEEQKSLLCFAARILKTREATPDDRFETGDMSSELGSVDKYKSHILEMLPINRPEKQQRREFYRMPLAVDIYCKIAGILKVENFIAGGGLKYDETKAKEAKEAADSGLLESEGYSRLTTEDLSAGGFRYKGKPDRETEEGTFLECVLIINDEGLPAVAQILSLKRDASSKSLFEIRALFHRISDPVRDKVIRYIFAKQREPKAEKDQKRKV